MKQEPSSPSRERDRLARRAILALGSALHGGTLAIREGGGTHVLGHGVEAVHMTIHDPGTWGMVATGGGNGLGVAYMRGYWETPDLTGLLRLLARNLDRINRVTAPLDRARQVAGLLRSRRPNRGADRRNIHAHYDLGNSFFELFLDPTMAYSCAIFEPGDDDLEAASRRKFDRVCDRLRLTADDHLLEIGTGWGGLAIHAAERYGCRVTTTTISREQCDFSRARVAAAGLADRVTVLDQNYRDLTGIYSKLVSVEMIEAVDWRLYDEFFRCCERLLAPHGLAVLQAIVIEDRAWSAARWREDFIKRYIFPGGFMPSVRSLVDAANRASGLRLVELDDIGANYPITLRHWREALDAHRDRALALGFDEQFLRMWRFYFAYCEAGFLERRISDVQLTFAGRAWRRMPARREPSAEVRAAPLAAVAGRGHA
ncbi:MAG: cyclopropane-fatty-acyl-phospholipid synthase family protein [Candidatus Dormiibacterota bacterium]|jgi:cyclopropane-fatty-acyl-phospholipid synthase